ARDLDRRAAEERRRELDPHPRVVDVDRAHDAEVDDGDDRELRIGDLGERVPDGALGQSKSAGHSGCSRWAKQRAICSRVTRSTESGGSSASGKKPAAVVSPPSGPGSPLTSSQRKKIFHVCQMFGG